MILLPVTNVTPNIFGDSPGLEHVEDATFVWRLKARGRPSSTSRATKTRVLGPQAKPIFRRAAEGMRRLNTWMAVSWREIAGKKWWRRWAEDHVWIVHKRAKKQERVVSCKGGIDRNLPFTSRIFLEYSRWRVFRCNFRRGRWADSYKYPCNCGGLDIEYRIIGIALCSEDDLACSGSFGASLEVVVVLLRSGGYSPPTGHDPIQLPGKADNVARTCKRGSNCKVWWPANCCAGSWAGKKMKSNVHRLTVAI